MNRLQKLRTKLEEKGLEAILIMQPENRHYLSAFTGSEGWLIITRDNALVAVDSRYIEQAKREATDWEVIQTKGRIADWLPETISNLNLNKVGFEAEYLSVSLYNHLVEVIKEKHLSFQLFATSSLVESLRTVKETEELGLILKAVNLADKAVEYASTIIRPAITEKELAWGIEKFLRNEGSGTLPFELIVASGPNSALPHARPSERKIAPGEPILIDIGARVDGYCSDLSRVFYLGKPDKRFITIYDAVLGAQLTALAMIETGMSGDIADSSARTVIQEAGYEKAFGHGLGHGIGLAPHELPRLAPDSTDVLTNGAVFTIEPGIYIEGWGGVRIEDVIVLEKNKPKVLSKAAKDLITHL